MKKVAVAAVVGLSALCWRTASAATTEIDGSTWSYTLSVSSDKTTTNATITADTPADGALVVPPAVDGYLVVAIGQSAFEGTAITSAVIPHSVVGEGLGRYAFKNCTTLRSVVIGNGITLVHYQDFYGCNHLEDVMLGSSVSGIGEYAFYGCSSLKRIVFPSSMRKI